MNPNNAEDLYLLVFTIEGTGGLYNDAVFVEKTRVLTGEQGRRGRHIHGTRALISDMVPEAELRTANERIQAEAMRLGLMNAIWDRRTYYGLNYPDSALTVQNMYERRISAEDLRRWNIGLMAEFVLNNHQLYGLEVTDWCREHKIDVTEFIKTRVCRLLELEKETGNHLVWGLGDYSQSMACNWPEAFKSRREACSYYRNMRTSFFCRQLERTPFESYAEYEKALQTGWLPPRNRCLSPAEKKIARRIPAYPPDYIRKVLGEDPRQHNIVCSTANIFDIHYHFEWGNSLVCHNDTHSHVSLQVAHAFLRGAARQYDGFWGYYDELSELFVYKHRNGRYAMIDINDSNWNAKMEWQGGLSAEIQLNRWIAGYMAGANTITNQKTCRTTWSLPALPQFKLTPMGKALKQFADFSLRRHRDRGKTIVPMALMLEHDHGWNPVRFGWRGRDSDRWHFDPQGEARFQAKRPWIGDEVVWACMPFEEGDYMLENFFEAAFPGFRERMRDDYPWATAAEYIELCQSGFDTRPYQHKMLTTSTWGDHFDVILDNCPQDVIASYPVVMLLGRVKMTRKRFAVLRGYAEGGGTLIINARQLGFRNDDLERFTGVKLTTEEKAATTSTCRECGARYEEGVYRYQRVEAATASVLADNEYGDPLITANAVGKGKVMLTLPDFLHDNNRSKLLEIGKDCVGHVMARHLPVEITGPPIEYIVNELGGGSCVVTLVNSSEKDWTGTVLFRQPKASRTTVREWWKEKTMPFEANEKDCTTRIRVPKFGSRMIEFVVSR